MLAAARAFSPLDEELGLLPGPWTPTLHEEIVRLAVWLPFAKAAQLTEAFRRVPVSEPTVRRLTETAGAALVAHETAVVERLERERPVPPAGPAVQQVSVDGAMVPLVHGEWAEVKTLAVGVVTPTADGAVRTTELSYFSRLADHARFTREALGELHRRGTERAGRVCFVVDGAEWEQQFIAVHHPHAVRILDWGHAAGYVATAGQAAFGAGTAAASAWIATWWHELRHGDPPAVLAELRQLQAELAPAAARAEAADVLPDECPPAAEGVRPDAAAHGVVTTSLEYLAKRQDQIRYAALAALGYPLGSGAVESANKLVVEARLKGSGMHWARPHVDPLVALRAAVCSDRWDAVWPAIASERRRAHRVRQRTRRAARRAAVVPPDRPPHAARADVTLGPGGARPQLPARRKPPAVIATTAAPARCPDAPTGPGRPAPDHPWRKPLFPKRSPATADRVVAVEK